MPEFNIEARDSAAQMEIYAKFFHGLSNPTRFKIVEALLDQELNVGQLVNIVEASQSQVSNQLACLKWCGYVASRQEGKYILYRISDQRVHAILQLAKEIVADNTEHIHSCTRM